MPARRTELRRTGGMAALFVSLVALVAGAVALGGRIDRARTLPGLSTSTDAERYAQNALGEIAPISAAFTERELGRETLRGDADDDAAVETPSEDGPSEPRLVPPPTIRGAPGPLPGLAPGGWVLNLRMSADRTTASPGDEIRYRMVVLNSGDEDFRGRSFLLEWHTPTNTFGRNPVQQCALAPPFISAICRGRRLLLSPGLGDARHERFDTSGLVMIRPGQRFVHDWFVQVLPSAAAGTRLVNHAHLTVSVEGQAVGVRSNDVNVTVG